MSPVRLVIDAFRDGLARLADVAPTQIVVPSEETDWGLVGADLRDAIDIVAGDIAPVDPAADHVDELVEA